MKGSWKQFVNDGHSLKERVKEIRFNKRGTVPYKENNVISKNIGEYTSLVLVFDN